MRKGERPLQVGTEGLELWEQRQAPPPDPGGGSPDRGGRRSAATLHRDPAARSTDPETSHQAAASMVDAAGAQRRAILNYLAAHPEGATADELDDRLGWRPSTAGRRLGELLALGLAVRLDGEEGLERLTRATRQGRQAYVHRRA